MVSIIGLIPMSDSKSDKSNIYISYVYIYIIYILLKFSLFSMIGSWMISIFNHPLMTKNYSMGLD